MTDTPVLQGELLPEPVAQLEPVAARALTERIKLAVDATWHLVKRAYVERAWAALGYETWDAYCTAEFGGSRLRLPREERQEVVGSLREAGLSTRAIAAATGLSKGTVGDALAGAQNRAPASTEPSPQAELLPRPEPSSVPPPRVLGADGKTYPAARPTPAPPPPETPEQAAERESRLIEQERLAAIRRDQARLEGLVNGWPTLTRLTTHPDRDDILTGLTDHDRQTILDIEATIHQENHDG